MGVVRFAMGFPHTFYVVAAPIPFRAMTAGIRMPAEILHAGPHDKGRSVLKDIPLWRETGQTFSTQERAALEWAEMLTLISETHAPEEIYRDIADFTEEEMIDLTIAIGPMNVFDRIANGFGGDLASS
jgi:predicted polyphosphate/ATP-dependent NAD kinase